MNKGNDHMTYTELENPITGSISIFEEHEVVEDMEDDISDEEFFAYLLKVAENGSDDNDNEIDEDYVPSQAEKEFYEKMIAIDIDISDDFKKFIVDTTHEDFMNMFIMRKNGSTEKEVMNYFS